MASDEDEDVDDIDEELARIERQIQELEEETAPEPEAPTHEDVDAPAPEEAFEGEPDVDEDEGRLSQLVSRLRGDDGETSDADEAEADDDGGVLGFLDRCDDEDEPADDAAEDEIADERVEDEDVGETVDDGDETAETEPSGPVDGEDEADEPRVDDEQDPEAEPAEATEDEAEDEEAEADEGMLAGFTDRFGSDDEEPDEVADAETEEEEADAGGVLGFLGDDEDEEDEETSPELAVAHGPAADEPPVPAGRPTPDEGESGPAAADDEEDDPRASALLARFQGGGSGDPEGGPAADEDDDDGGGLIVGALVALLLLAGLAAGAYFLLPGSSADESLSPNLVASSFTNDQGNYVATAGEPVTLDASGSNGTIDEYVWRFGDGTEQTTSGPTVEHTYDQRGTYTAEVTIKAGDSKATTSISVAVVQPPAAQAGVLRGGEPAAEPSTIGNNVYVGDQVTLDGSGSGADPNHSITAYEWDLDGDGEPETTGEQAQVSFDKVGAWNVQLTVRDDLGNENTTTRRVHVSAQRLIEDTIGPSSTEPSTNNYSVPVDRARLDARPVQLDVQLTYNASSNDTGGLPVQPSVDANLDLNVTDPEGNVYEAEDDNGQGNETITVEGADLANLGEWTVNVRQDNQNAGTASEVEYELSIETIY